MMTSLTCETGLKENMKSNQTSSCASLTSDQIHVNQVRLHVTRLLRFVPQTLQTDRLTLIREIDTPSSSAGHHACQHMSCEFN